MARDLGDFQTPPALVAAVLAVLFGAGEYWPRVLEPTCGQGNFIAGLLRLARPPREIQGVECQAAHVAAARQVTAAGPASRVVVRQGDLFALDLAREIAWQERGPLLVVGNPPWVTSAELGALGSRNGPPRRNLKGRPGLAARTGEGNFDLAEAVWIKLIQELAPARPTIALLCKTGVARNVLQFAHDAGLPVAGASIRRIAAGKWFGAAVSACLFTLRVGPPGAQPYAATVYPDLAAAEPEALMGIANGRLVADLPAYRQWAFAHGTCPLTWRQGLKHDAAGVAELTCAPDGLRNRLGEKVAVEPAYVYPLLKGSDLARAPGLRPQRRVIVTQHRLGEDTRALAQAAPRLWQYLCGHAPVWARRKSSVYRGQPPFAMFGVGDYAFAPYKVAISGLHKAPGFHAIGPVDGRPVLLDDTCYFVPCNSAAQAGLLAALLNHPATLGLVRALAFPDAKRPITKGLLQGLDLGALLRHVGRAPLLALAQAQLARLDAGPGPERAWPDDLAGLLTGASGRRGPG